MARNADQIVAAQLGNLHLQLAIAQARAEQAEEKVVELATHVSVLEAQLSDAGLTVDRAEPKTEPKNMEIVEKS